MAYSLGVDLGTTFTAAALMKDGRAEVANLGSRSAAIPSVVLLRVDETVLTGEAASRRALSEPDRVAREFKRRLGDTTPVLLGSTPYSVEALMSRLLRAVVAEVSAREGSPPERVAVSHPANWGAYKQDLLRQAVRLADLDDVVFLTEPEAAAVHYASQERIDVGEIVAVYDLGGGTFDAAVLRRLVDGFEILGQPEGIERLGGIDFDAAVLAHVDRALGGRLAALDDSDAATVAAVARLRVDCTEAKEALSADTDTTISVLLPTVQTEVRLTRAEFEAMVRPALIDSIDALRRALRSAGVSPDDVDRVLLTGGSSRIPLVAQMVGAELGRPVVVDAHPKHAVALGAARAAARRAGDPTPVAPPPPPPPPPSPPPAAASGDGGPAPASGARIGALPVPERQPAPEPAAAAASVLPPLASGPPGARPPVGDTTGPSGGADPRLSGPPRPNRRLLLVGLAVAAVLVLAGVVVLRPTGGGDDGAAPTTFPAAAITTVPTGGNPASSSVAATAAVVSTTVPDPCGAVRSLPKYACITAVRLDGTGLTVDYEFSLAGAAPDKDVGEHFHFYSSAIGEEEAGVPGGGPWVLWDDLVFVQPLTSAILRGATELCVLVAMPGHGIIPGTGTCVDLTAEVREAVSAAV